MGKHCLLGSLLLSKFIWNWWISNDMFDEQGIEMYSVRIFLGIAKFFHPICHQLAVPSLTVLLPLLDYIGHNGEKQPAVKTGTRDSVIYCTSQDMHRFTYFVVVCCRLFARIFQGYFTGTKAIIGLPQSPAPEGTKPLPELTFTYHQCGPVTFIWGQF